MYSHLHNAHLTYCSNIHPGESWHQTFANLKIYTTQVRDRLHNIPFGIGLRLSHEASIELAQPELQSEFQGWLRDENMYVFTINGFPYGGFHGQVVKDKVHHPDWTTSERLQYSIRLFDILKNLLPAGMDGGVSTSPISYRFWHPDDLALNEVKKRATEQLMALVLHLDRIYQKSGQVLHLDIEPEPDGVLETTEEFIDFYQQFLLETGCKILQNKMECSRQDAETKIRRHIQLCYDVCHFAVGFEDSDQAIESIISAQIKIGRLQISAALSSGVMGSLSDLANVAQELAEFDEPTYLHQAVIKNHRGQLSRFRDLKPALEQWHRFESSELRTHFHVPVFTEKYGTLISTQPDIIQVLNSWKERNFTNHLEVETYTWNVLPADMQTGIVNSIVRELEWVQSHLQV
ncbi:MAG: metabolite traffic protein EboE [Saprospiraceae bacterium]|nr:metabolite traffic protein EboE [Saprospiraceae bacterium]